MVYALEEHTFVAVGNRWRVDTREVPLQELELFSKYLGSSAVLAVLRTLLQGTDGHGFC